MRTKLFLIAFALIALISCDRGEDNDLSFEDPSFLLVDSSDPSGLVSGHALMLDARGPILFDLLDLLIFLLIIILSVYYYPLCFIIAN